MIVVFCLLVLGESITYNTIPSTGSPPDYLASSAAVYDSKTNCIITIGGENIITTKATSDINIFNLTSNKWSSPRIISASSPPGFYRLKAYLRSDRKILVIGVYSDVHIFNLEDYSWSSSPLQGDLLYGVYSYAMTEVKTNSKTYVAIFGGMTPYDYTNSLYLIDVDNLISKKLKNDGTPPSPRTDSTLIYYKDSLYMYGYSYNDYLSGKETGSEIYRYDLNQQIWTIVKTQSQGPGPRNYHYSYIYNGEMYILFGMQIDSFNRFPSIYKFNFESNLWTYVTSNPNGYALLAADVLISSSIYLIYINTENNIIKIDLNQNLSSSIVVSPSFTSPPKRLFHCSAVVGEILYVFGGTDSSVLEGQNFYNDLWAFDFTKLEWTSIQTNGSPPSPRRSFGCLNILGEYIAVFGGKGSEGYLNDFYYFYILTQTWYGVTSPNNIYPSPRSHSCLIYFGINLYIIGGRNDIVGFNDIWTLNFNTNEFTDTGVKITWALTSASDDIIDAQCWGTYTGNTLVLNVAGGENLNKEPNPYIFKIFAYSNNTYEVRASLFGDFTTMGFIGSETSTIKSGDYLIRMGGSMFQWVILKNILIYNIKNDTYKVINGNDYLGVYGHSLSYYKNSLYVFGGGGAVGVYRSEKIFKNDFIEIKLDEKLECSDGFIGDNCEPCPEGTYFSSGKCLKCPKGRFNNKKAMINIIQCIACPEGYFNNKEGAAYCLECTSGSFCPLNSKEPLPINSFPSDNSMQPKSLVTQHSFISKFSIIVWYCAASVIGLLVLSTFFFHKFQSSLSVIDFFSSRHNKKLGMPIVHKKTNLGGLFTLIFIVFSFAISIGSFISYNINNITETKGLIPSILLDTSIVAKTVIVNTSFYIYGGSCVVDNSCNPAIILTEDGFNYSNRTIHCIQNSQNCQLNIEYSSFFLQKKNSYILLSLNEIDSYALAFYVNITSFSSIPDEFSSTSTILRTGVENTVFRGPTPSELYYTFTPSLFTSESSDWPDKLTGFHVYLYNNPKIGSIVYSQNVYTTIFLNLKINIIQSETSVKTERVVNQTWFVFIGSMFGSIFGFMGLFASLMRITEILSDKFYKKESKSMKKIIKNSVCLKNENLITMQCRLNFNKIVPLRRDSINITGVIANTE